MADKKQPQPTEEKLALLDTPERVIIDSGKASQVEIILDINHTETVSKLKSLLADIKKEAYFSTKLTIIKSEKSREKVFFHLLQAIFQDSSEKNLRTLGSFVNAAAILCGNQGKDIQEDKRSIDKLKTIPAINDFFSKVDKNKGDWLSKTMLSYVMIFQDRQS